MVQVYKIVPKAAWKTAEGEGIFRGFGIDLNDPFIHLSSRTQIAGTLEKFFRDVEGLSIVEIDADKLGKSLVWEKSDDEVIFPHLYGPLPLAAVIDTFDLVIDENGNHILPSSLSDD